MLILLVSFHIILPDTTVIVGCNEVKSSTEKKNKISFFLGWGGVALGRGRGVSEIRGTFESSVNKMLAKVLIGIWFRKQ
jgi:hypothetical protein